MVCEHLSQLEQAILSAGIPETFRGQAWGKDCREWVYFACVIDIEKVQARFRLASSVVEHEHVGTHDGQELGLVCEDCHDAIIGFHPKFKSDAAYFPRSEQRAVRITPTVRQAFGE